MTLSPETKEAVQSVECSFCGNQLDDEEADNPRTDPYDDQPCCDDCYHEHFEFTCCDCCEYGDIEDQHNLLVVFDDDLDVKTGIYRVTGRPYFTHAMIGSGWLHKWHLQRIADVSPDMDGEGYPCGHLCLKCQGNVLAQFLGRCSVCKRWDKSCLKVRLGSWKYIEADIYQWTRTKTVCAGCRHARRGAWERNTKGGHHA